MRDTNDSWLQSGRQQAWLSFTKLEEEVPRFALLEEAIEDLIEKQLRKHRHESKDQQSRKPAKKTFIFKGRKT